jgi:hypothetical protein
MISGIGNVLLVPVLTKLFIANKQREFMIKKEKKKAKVNLCIFAAKEFLCEFVYKF